MPEQEQTQPHHKTFLVVAIIAIVVILGIGGVFLYLSLQGPGLPASDPEPLGLEFSFSEFPETSPELAPPVASTNPVENLPSSNPFIAQTNPFEGAYINPFD